MAANQDYIKCEHSYVTYGPAATIHRILEFAPPSPQQARDMMYSRIENDLNIKTKEDLKNDKHETH